MKSNNIFIVAILISTVCLLSSCDSFMDRVPETKPVPEKYFNETVHLMDYVNGRYTDILPSHTSWDYGLFKIDNGTDNQVSSSADNKYLKGLWLVSEDKGDWDFDNIMRMNLFFDNVLPKYEKGEIKGNISEIEHYIGEAYFLRAFEYFKRYQKYGDFPLVTTEYPDDIEILTNVSKRYPRNEVARFILSDLDKAIDLMSGGFVVAKTRINKDAVVLFKSRVALYEATWLKYFKGTAFVPQGDGWPGKTKDYTIETAKGTQTIKNYIYPLGGIDEEIAYFLDVAMESSKEIADKYVDKLTVNTGTIQQALTEQKNPFMDMFGDPDLSKYDEVLLWREYKQGFATHSAVIEAQRANNGIGLTRGLVHSFLMKNGLPIYDGASGYQGDDIIVVDSKTFKYKTRIDRDNRLSLFLKEPEQKNVLEFNEIGVRSQRIEPIPNLTSTTTDFYPTGFAMRKGNNYLETHCANNGSFTGAIVFRAAEALLNYMEASYEKNGAIDADADRYWRALRKRAGVDENYNKTIAATVMTEELKNDWGAYSAGDLINTTLYNIRRERRSEFMGEALRSMDLYRWRSMDQLIATPYHVEGLKVWNSGIDTYYKFTTNGGARANMSAATLSDYIRVFQKQNADNAFNGLTWHMAHYLNPVGLGQLRLTSSTTDIKGSIIYQNPYWPLQASYPAEQ